VKRRESGLLAVLLLAGTPAEAGLDASDRCVWHRETRWKAGDFVPSTNDTLEICRLEGDRPAVRIAGRGESCALRRARYRLSLPMRVSVRIRWSEPRFESAYPTAHLVWDPPEISDGWWERPMVGESGMGQWNGGRQGYLFHFPSASSGYSQHGVSERLETAECRRLGPLIERHPAFPNRTNVQFVQVAGQNKLDILIWERGAGYTLASGSSSCGSAAAAVRNGLCQPGRVAVRMPGGELSVEVRRDWSLRLEGPAEEVYTGALSEEFAETYVTSGA